MTGGQAAEQARLAAALAVLAHAEQRLRTIRRRALSGGYDAPAFARAVAACREAEAEVRRARSAFIPPAAPNPPNPAAPAAPAAETEAPGAGGLEGAPDEGGDAAGRPCGGL
jgi:hypothetical protein